jgi:hypothetical protein
LLEQASSETGMSVVEICKLVQEVAMAGTDPLPLAEQGDPFDFDEWREPPSENLWALSAVPPPDARVDLRVAWALAQEDARRCASMLEHHAAELSLPVLKHIHDNTVAWMRFWAARHPDAEWRVMFARQAEIGDAQTARVQAKAAKLLRARR